MPRVVAEAEIDVGRGDGRVHPRLAVPAHDVTVRIALGDGKTTVEGRPESGRRYLAHPTANAHCGALCGNDQALNKTIGSRDIPNIAIEGKLLPRRHHHVGELARCGGYIVRPIVAGALEDRRTLADQIDNTHLG